MILGEQICAFGTLGLGSNACSGRGKGSCSVCKLKLTLKPLHADTVMQGGLCVKENQSSVLQEQP